MNKDQRLALNNSSVTAVPAATLKGPVLGGIFVASAQSLSLLVAAGDRVPSCQVRRRPQRVAAEGELLLRIRATHRTAAHMPASTAQATNQALPGPSE